MPQDLLKQDVNVGNIAFSWSFNEYEKYNRGKRWYWTMGLLSVALIAFAVYTANYLFALIIVLFGIIIFLQEMNEPMELDFGLTDTGIVLGTKYYAFSELEKYWIVYNPPMVKVLYFEPKSAIKHRLHIPLIDETDPVVLRDYLNQYLIEDLDKEDEPLSDRLGRMLKIQ